jgi:hypothetical protein
LPDYTEHHSLFIPHSLSHEDGRRLSIDLGGGACEWTLPEYDVPANINFHKTVIAGYPSGDKRMIFLQMEALTGWRKLWLSPNSYLFTETMKSFVLTARDTFVAAKDEWDFWGLGMSNHPFIKANYPHHEGIWGWDDAADQVVMIVRNIRKSMLECEFIFFPTNEALLRWVDRF